MPPPFLTERELHGINQIRKQFGHKIPADLNTDFHLARWWRWHHGNIDQVEQHFLHYLDNRRLCDAIGDDFIEHALDDELTQKYLPFLRLSKLDDRAWSEKMNGFLFIEGGVAQPKEWLRTINCLDYMYMTFRYCEYVQRLVLKREAQTGRPAHGIIIFDMADANIMHWINPLSVQTRVWQLRTDVWQEYFPEIVQHVIVSQPPALMSIFWQVARFFMNENTRRILKVHLAHKKEDVTKFVEPDIVPVHYGGKFKDSKEWGDPDTCCSIRRKYTHKDFYKIGSIWKKFGVEEPELEHIVIKPHHTFRVEKEVKKAGAKLAWQFSANGELVFGVFRQKDGGDEPQVPIFPLITSVLPEERMIECQAAGNYFMEFENRSGFFNVKLEYAMLCNE